MFMHLASLANLAIDHLEFQAALAVLELLHNKLNFIHQLIRISHYYL